VPISESMSVALNVLGVISLGGLNYYLSAFACF